MTPIVFRGNKRDVPEGMEPWEWGMAIVAIMEEESVDDKTAKEMLTREQKTGSRNLQPVLEVCPECGSRACFLANPGSCRHVRRPTVHRALEGPQVDKMEESPEVGKARNKGRKPRKAEVKA